MPLAYKKSGANFQRATSDINELNEIVKKKLFGKSGTYQESLYTCSDESPLLYTEGKGSSASAGKSS